LGLVITSRYQLPKLFDDRVFGAPVALPRKADDDPGMGFFSMISSGIVRPPFPAAMTRFGGDDHNPAVLFILLQKAGMGLSGAPLTLIGGSAPQYDSTACMTHVRQHDRGVGGGPQSEDMELLPSACLSL